MPLTFAPFYTARAAALAITLCAVALRVAPADAQKPPDISPWKIVTSKAVGVSCLMPPGTVAANLGLPFDPKKGALLASVLFDAPDADGKQTYGLIAVRANQAGLDGLLAEARANGVTIGKKTAIDLLYEAQFKPLLNDAILWVSDDPKRASVTRKPLAWHGMKGEEIQITRRAAPNEPAAFLYVRVVKDAHGIFMVTAGEKNPTPAAFARARRVFDSFTIAPGGTFVPPPAKPTRNKPPAKP